MYAKSQGPQNLTTFEKKQLKCFARRYFSTEVKTLCKDPRDVLSIMQPDGLMLLT